MHENLISAAFCRLPHSTKKKDIAAICDAVVDLLGIRFGGVVYIHPSWACHHMSFSPAAGMWPTVLSAAWRREASAAASASA